MKLYLVYMVRWGDRGNHSYPIAIAETQEEAKTIGAMQRDYRGGKYDPYIFEFDTEKLPNKPDLGYDPADGDLHYGNIVNIPMTDFQDEVEKWVLEAETNPDNDASQLRQAMIKLQIRMNFLREKLTGLKKNPDAHKAYMCATDFDVELPMQAPKIVIHNDPDEIQCGDECGVYEVMVTKWKTIKKPLSRKERIAKAKDES